MSLLGAIARKVARRAMSYRTGIHCRHPTEADIARFSRSALERVSDGMRRRSRRFVWRSSAYRAKRLERLRNELDGSEGVVFVCLGNICRSPFAEMLAAQIMPASAAARWRISSTGLLDRVGRRSPSEAVATARDFDVDLADHRSTSARESLFENRVIFAMDHWIFDEMLKRYPRLSKRTFLLGELSPARSEIEAPDPYGQPREVFAAVFHRIRQDVQRLTAEMARLQGP